MQRLLTKLMMIAAAVLALLLSGPAFAQRAGTLADAQPVANAPTGVRAWRVQYWTAGNKGQPIRVTGMVIAPLERGDRAGPRSVIAWTHGALGVAQRCAPSLGDLNFTMIPALGDAIRRGYVVVAPDYPGLGSDMMHPFLVGVSTGRSVLDAVRAVRDMSEVNAGQRFAVWGESQGGHAALWTGQLARSYAPDLTLVGVAAVVPPTDLARNFAEGKDQNARALLTAFTARNWSSLYGAPMSTFGPKSTQNVLNRLADNNCVEFNAKPKLGTILGILIARGAVRKVDLARIEPWARLMRENSPSPAAVPVPLLMVQGTADVIVAPAVTLDFARKACARGKILHYVSVVGGEHGTVARTEAAATLDWIDARFSGKPAPNNCRGL